MFCFFFGGTPNSLLFVPSQGETAYQLHYRHGRTSSHTVREDFVEDPRVGDVRPYLQSFRHIEIQFFRAQTRKLPRNGVILGLRG